MGANTPSMASRLAGSLPRFPIQRHILQPGRVTPRLIGVVRRV